MADGFRVARNTRTEVYNPAQAQDPRQTYQEIHMALRGTRSHQALVLRSLLLTNLFFVVVSTEPVKVLAENKPGTETVSLPALHQPVEILIDHWGVPHIYAKNEADLFFAQGFNAARDRLFQIDLWRRRGLGRLAEVFGPAFLEQDRAARLFLYRGDMQQEWASYSNDAQQIATNFVA